MNEFDRLKAQKDSILGREGRALEVLLKMCQATTVEAAVSQLKQHFGNDKSLIDEFLRMRREADEFTYWHSIAQALGVQYHALKTAAEYLIANLPEGEYLGLGELRTVLRGSAVTTSHTVRG